MKAIAVLTLACAGAAVAIAAPFTPDAEVRAPLPLVQVINGVGYMNGGAGVYEAEYLKSRGAEFPLQLMFSGRGGEYGVAEKVTVSSDNRELISVPDAGPFLLLKLPPGRYTVEASFKSGVEKRTVVIGNGVSKVNWNTLRASD